MERRVYKVNDLLINILTFLLTFCWDNHNKKSMARTYAHNTKEYIKRIKIRKIEIRKIRTRKINIKK